MFDIKDAVGKQVTIYFKNSKYKCSGIVREMPHPALFVGIWVLEQGHAFTFIRGEEIMAIEVIPYRTPAEYETAKKPSKSSTLGAFGDGY